MDGYVTTPIGPFASAASATLGTFTTRADMTPLPAPILLPYQLRPGSKLKLEAEGEWSTTGSPTFIVGFYLGTSIGANGAPGAITTIIAESGAITVGAGAAAWPWRLEWRGTVTTVGTSAVLLGQGNLEAGATSITALTSSAIPITQALRSVTINNSNAMVLGVCATCGTSNASNTIKTNNFTALLLN